MFLAKNNSTLQEDFHKLFLLMLFWTSVCDDIEMELNVMKSKGLRILTPPQPGEAFENKDIAFVFAKQGLNIELIDTEKRAGVKAPK